MKEDKKEVQFDPAENEASPAPAQGPIENVDRTTPQQDEGEGDFVVVGSGLGIDE